MKLFKVFLFSILAMLLMNFTVDARSNSPDNPDGYNITQVKAFSYDVAVDDLLTDTGNMVMQMYNSNSEDVPLYVKIHGNYYIELKESNTGLLYLDEIIFSPLLLLTTDNQKKSWLITQTDKQKKNKDYTEIGYNMKK